jgi:hypothetical protein
VNRQDATDATDAKVASKLINFEVAVRQRGIKHIIHTPETLGVLYVENDKTFQAVRVARK